MRKIVKLRTCKSYHFETGLKTVSFFTIKVRDIFTNHVTITLATGNKKTRCSRKKECRGRNGTHDCEPRGIKITKKSNFSRGRCRRF